MAEAAARHAEAAGAFLIDINVGCPVRKIARIERRQQLIRQPELAAAIMRPCGRGSARSGDCEDPAWLVRIGC